MKVKRFSDTLDNWKARAKSAPNRRSGLPLSLLQIVKEDEDSVIWTLNYDAFKAEWKKQKELQKNCFNCCCSDEPA